MQFRANLKKKRSIAAPQHEIWIYINALLKLTRNLANRFFENLRTAPKNSDIFMRRNNSENLEKNAHLLADENGSSAAGLEFVAHDQLEHWREYAENLGSMRKRSARKYERAMRRS